MPSMIAANRAELLKRIPKGHALHAAATGMIDLAETFAARSAQIQSSKELTDAGKRQRLREVTPDAVRTHASRFAAVKREREKVEQRWASLKNRTFDPENAAAAIERAEIRTYLRGLDAMALTVVAETSQDTRILEAMLSAPPELSGLIGPQMKEVGERTARRYLTLLNGNVVEQIERDEALIEEAEAIATIALLDIQASAGMTDLDMKAIDVTRDAGRPWLYKEDQAVMCRRPGHGFGPATAREIETGVYFANLDAWAKANGYESGEAAKTAIEAQRQAEAA